MSAYCHRHKPQCNQYTCYCLDENEGDPMCDCGNPAWRCSCDEDAKKEEMEEQELEQEYQYLMERFGLQ